MSERLQKSRLITDDDGDATLRAKVIPLWDALYIWQREEGYSI